MGNAGKEQNYADIHGRTRSHGYATGATAQLGIGPGILEHIAETYFNSDVLEPEKYDVFPPDRERARDVIHYKWNNNGTLELREFDSITIGRRSYTSTKQREYARTEFLNDPKFVEYVTAILELVPPEKRHVEGTMGINLFRTRSAVVSGPHRDDEEYAFMQCVGKHGGGARTQIFEEGEPCMPPKPLAVAVLKPGDFAFVNDQERLHNVTPLEKALDGSAPWRDVVVCTIDKSDAPYIGQERESRASGQGRG